MTEPAYWIRRFEVPNVKFEGWAVIVIDAKGFLGIISDYGDYAYHWSSFGGDFANFLMGLNNSYLTGKLSHGQREYDERTTLREIKRHIIQLRRDGDLDTTQAREEWQLLRDNDDLSRPEWYGKWTESTKLDFHDLYFTRPPPQLTGFLERVWPRFIALLKENPPTAEPLIVKKGSSDA